MSKSSLDLALIFINSKSIYLSPEQKDILLAVAKFQISDLWCKASQQKIAKECEFCRATVNRNLKKLVDLGVLICEKVAHHVRNGWTKCWYKLSDFVLNIGENMRKTSCTKTRHVTQSYTYKIKLDLNNINSPSLLGDTKGLTKIESIINKNIKNTIPEASTRRKDVDNIYSATEMTKDDEIFRTLREESDGKSLPPMATPKSVSKSELENFNPAQEHKDFCKEHDIELDREHKKFIDFNLRRNTPLTNANAAFMGWLRKTKDFTPPPNSEPTRSIHYAKELPTQIETVSKAYPASKGPPQRSLTQGWTKTSGGFYTDDRKATKSIANMTLGEINELKEKYGDRWDQ